MRNLTKNGEQERGRGIGRREREGLFKDIKGYYLVLYLINRYINTTFSAL